MPLCGACSNLTSELADWDLAGPGRWRRWHLFGKNDRAERNRLEPSLGRNHAMGPVGDVQVAESIRRHPVIEEVSNHHPGSSGCGAQKRGPGGLGHQAPGA
jgi:hypothetical protein